ncbi:hypothetical protein EDD11_003265 [Mortierella claussenii]|nr:hypothetical protein EDD11_003265 [Mortierella claussenii]
MSMSGRHRALLGSLLAISIRPAFHHNGLDRISKASDNPQDRAATTTSSSARSALSRKTASEDRLGTGARGTDVENNSQLDSAPQDYSVMSQASLKQLLRGSIFETLEDLSDPSRSVRLWNSNMQSKLGSHSDLVDNSQALTEDGSQDVGANTNVEGYQEGVGRNSSDGTGDTHEDGALGINGSLEREQQEGSLPLLVRQDALLSAFDVNKVLSHSHSYLLFIPSGETIEAQFFSLITSLWIAKHSNRTLIVPPPMMAPPSLHRLYPLFAGSKGKKRQRWSNLFDLRPISDLQPVVLMDNTRPVLQTPFTSQMAFEEEKPTVSQQAISFMQPLKGSVTEPATTTAAAIKCHGPPTAGSWKALDFAGRHFLNRYNLLASFEVLEDSYWDLSPEAIKKHWQAQSFSDMGNEQGRQEDADRYDRLVCISGADLIGAEDPKTEELIWQDIGSHIPFSGFIRLQARQSVAQVLRALEKENRMWGYIGVHIDKRPSAESCRYKSAPSWTPSCSWTVDQIARRVALLQQTEVHGVRPVVVTTTETDPELLAEMDRQPGWLRVGEEDESGGLFDTSREDLGGYGASVTRSFLMASSAIFLGSRSSAPSVHAAFRIKHEGRLRQVVPRWELY